MKYVTNPPVDKWVRGMFRGCFINKERSISVLLAHDLFCLGQGFDTLVEPPHVRLLVKAKSLGNHGNQNKPTKYLWQDDVISDTFPMLTFGGDFVRTTSNKWFCMMDVFLASSISSNNDEQNGPFGVMWYKIPVTGSGLVSMTTCFTRDSCLHTHTYKKKTETIIKYGNTFNYKKLINNYQNWVSRRTICTYNVSWKHFI